MTSTGNAVTRSQGRSILTQQVVTLNQWREFPSRKGIKMITRSFSVMRLLLSFTVFGMFMAAGPMAPRSAQAATLVVDDDGQATALDCDASQAAFDTVQAAVDAVAPGDTIQICPGIYDEQVAVTASHVTIRGAGPSLTVLRPTAVVQNAINLFGNPVGAIMLVKDAADLTIANLAIDGSAPDSGATSAPPCSTLPFYFAIYFQNSSGAVETAHVTGIQSGTACAFAIRAETGDMVVKTSLIDEYGTTGIACAFTGTRCNLTGNTIRGRGPVDDELQAGIQIRSGAAGKIAGNVITDHAFIGAQGVPQSAVGIVLVYATPTSNRFLIR